MIKYKKSEETIKPTNSQEVDGLNKNEKSASAKVKGNKAERPQVDPKTGGRD